MANIFLAIFLFLFGFMHLVDTKIPLWVLGLAALVAGLVIGFYGITWKRKPNP